MARKSYDQRLKERWLRKEREERVLCNTAMNEFYKMENTSRYVAAFILPIISHGRNR